MLDLVTVDLMKDRFERYKRCGDILVDYDEILLYYPDYFKKKVELEKKKFVSKDVIDSYFEENYQQSNLYQKLEKLAMAKEEIYIFMVQNKDLRWELFKLAFEKHVEKCIELCNLIDYIGHYPTTYPVPREEEKDFAMEELLEKYDIMVRYHLSEEFDKMQITSDDIMRIMLVLNRLLSDFESINTVLSKEGWMFEREAPEIKFKENMLNLIKEVDFFPESNFQEKGRSKREEGKRYLRKQHGKRVI